MESKIKMANEIAALAKECGINTEEAYNDIASSFEKPNKLMARHKLPSDNILSGYGEAWIKWWDIFLREYLNKCIERWGTIYGRSLDADTLRAYWFERFQPLWMAGCDVAKSIRMKEFQEAVTMYMEHVVDLNNEDKLEAQAWIERIEEAASQAVTLFKESHSEALDKTIAALKDFDNTNIFGKLKRRIFG